MMKQAYKDLRNERTTIRRVLLKGESMKIAACDFDGTLYRNGSISTGDLEAIAHWRRAGHAFGIVTGRGRNTLLRDMERFAVPYDFLVCNNGAMICDAQAQDVYCASLPQPVRSAIMEHPGMQACSQCAFFAGTAQYTHAGKTPYCIVQDNLLPRLSPDAALSLPALHQISLAYADPAASVLWADALAATCGAQASVHFSSICLDITAPEVSKASGMERLVRLRHWEQAPVFVIGDDRNDLPMIRHFRGYAVDNAAPDVQAAASGVFSSVGQMLREQG